MAQRKAHEVDAWLARPDAATSIVLIYGPDRGLVAERAKRFAAASGVDLSDPFTVMRIDAHTLEQEPGRLVDEARTVPMFSDRRLIWVLDAGAQKSLSESMGLLVAEPSAEALILIEAGELKKSAPLRTLIEKASCAMALPCYADEGKGLDALIDEELKSADLTITLEARQRLRESLGGDRMASRQELAKLMLYCAGKERIDIAEVEASVGDAAGISVDKAVDAMLAGDLERMDRALDQLARTGLAPFLILSATMRQMQQLLLMRQAMDKQGTTAAAAVAGARPPVFFTRRSLVQTALQARSAQSLTAALKRLQASILETRRRADLAWPLTRQTMLALSTESRPSPRAVA